MSIMNLSKLRDEGSVGPPKEVAVVVVAVVVYPVIDVVLGVGVGVVVIKVGPGRGVEVLRGRGVANTKCPNSSRVAGCRSCPANASALFILFTSLVGNSVRIRCISGPKEMGTCEAWSTLNYWGPNSEQSPNG